MQFLRNDLHKFTEPAGKLRTTRKGTLASLDPNVVAFLPLRYRYMPILKAYEMKFQLRTFEGIK